MGGQFVEATDSLGANIAEGYGRFHYLERVKFCYNSRASLSECNDHWIEILNERGKVDSEKYRRFKITAEKLSPLFIDQRTININKYRERSE